MTDDTRLHAFRSRARRDVAIWATLLGLGALSFAMPFLKLGPLSIVVNLLLAAVQIVGLGLFFMDLRRARPLIALTSTAAFLFVGVMFLLTLNDLFTRV